MEVKINKKEAVLVIIILLLINTLAGLAVGHVIGWLFPDKKALKKSGEQDA